MPETIKITRLKKYFYKTLRVLAWIIGILILLILILFIAIQIPVVQNFAKDKAVSYLEEKIKTKVVIDNFEMGFPKKFVLEGVYLENQEKDTLFFKIDKQYTISPTITPNLSNRTYTEYIKVARQQKLQTKKLR